MYSGVVALAGLVNTLMDLNILGVDNLLGVGSLGVVHLASLDGQARLTNVDRR